MDICLPTSGSWEWTPLPGLFLGGRPEVLFSSDKSDTRCEGILLEEITSQIPIFTAFLLGPPRILECRYQLYSNDLFPFVSK